jgi:hypothetical protein
MRPLKLQFSFWRHLTFHALWLHASWEAVQCRLFYDMSGLPTASTFVSMVGSAVADVALTLVLVVVTICETQRRHGDNRAYYNDRAFNGNAERMRRALGGFGRACRIEVWLVALLTQDASDFSFWMGYWCSPRPSNGTASLGLLAVGTPFPLIQTQVTRNLAACQLSLYIYPLPVYH